MEASTSIVEDPYHSKEGWIDRIKGFFKNSKGPISVTSEINKDDETNFKIEITNASATLFGNAAKVELTRISATSFLEMTGSGNVNLWTVFARSSGPSYIIVSKAYELVGLSAYQSIYICKQ